MELSADCLDRWSSDFGDFRYDFLRFCNELCRCLGYDFSHSQALLEAAHKGWSASQTVWLSKRMGSETTSLSHIKILGILLHHLCRVDWVTEVREFPNDEFEFNGTAEEQEETRKDLAGGPEAFFALHFVLAVINWHETARTDRRMPFEYRMTADMYHDLMAYVLCGERTELGVVMVLKALYVRDPV